jgi:hypothetical protein
MFSDVGDSLWPVSDELSCQSHDAAHGLTLPSVIFDTALRHSAYQLHVCAPSWMRLCRLGLIEGLYQDLYRCHSICLWFMPAGSL